MANPFEIVVQQLIDLGFYNFLFPFIITAALFFALLKKSKILGESVSINAAVSLSVAFLVFGFPVLAGISLATPLATFFTQVTVWILIIVVGLVFASFFYPDLTGFLSKMITSRTMLFEMITLGVALMIISGLVITFSGQLSDTPRPGQPPGPPLDVALISAAVIIFVVIILIASSIASIRK